MKKAVLALGALVAVDLLFGLAARALLPPHDRFGQMQQERVYRVRSPIYHHDLKPSTKATGGWGPRRHAVYTNSLGFKAPRVEQVPFDSEKRRLLFIGDSFTEGIGVEYPLTFVGRIGEALAPHGVEVLNAAVASYSPAIYYRKLKYWIVERGLKVDHVVVLVDVSDIEDEALYYELVDDRVVDRTDSPIHHAPTMDTIEVMPQRPWKEQLILSSLTLRTAYAVRAAWQPPPDPNGPGRRHGFLGGTPRGTWTHDDAAFERFGRRGSALARERLDMLLGLLRERGVGLTVGAYPWPDQIIEGDRGERHAGMLRRWAEANGVPFIDLYPWFVNQEPALSVLQRYYILGDTHFNEAGHEYVARIIMQKLPVRP